MDFTLYWFMFPVAIMVATMAMLSGVGGTAFFMPIFLLVFPWLGPEYPVSNPVTAVAAALLTSSFGFTSGFIGYYRKKLIDFHQGKQFLLYSAPAALLGVLVAHWINPILLRLGYGLLLMALAYIMIKGFSHLTKKREPLGEPRTKISSSGTSYHYFSYLPRPGVTLVGGMITGMMATGIGEVIIPQLVKDGKFPFPVAAATSVVAVMGTLVIASSAHVITLVQAGGLSAVPWNLVCYTIPGVIIGGQIGPLIQGRIATNVLSKILAWFFLFIGLCMIWTVYTQI